MRRFSRNAIMRVLPILIFLGLSAGFLTACGESAGQSEPASHPATAKPVRVAPVTRTDTLRQYALTGVTRAANRATLAFQVSGNLSKRPVNIGDRVEPGQLIAELSNPEAGPQADAARARLSELNTRLAQAERDLTRVENLFEQEAATRQELESARASRDALQASRDNARAQLSRSTRTLDETRIKSPVEGTVDRVLFEPGEFVPAGQPVVSLSGGGLTEVEIGVPENLIDSVEVGQPATLRLPLFEGRTVSGRVSEFASASTGAGQLFPVVITLDAGQSLRAGLTVEWLLDATQPQRLTVPVTAVVSPGGSGQPRVYRVVDGRATAVPVKLGAIMDENVIVEGELEAGQSIIVAGLNNITDGRPVEVLP
ncbi:MAG: efflux transporter periplasmic adaptor subunit [Salinisphaeraceae bacterium]|nr:efflux transporter periplasmic adaptor subunit [Salinisphaeraceae bacterium]